jgi:hypothetical protein
MLENIFSPFACKKHASSQRRAYKWLHSEEVTPSALNTCMQNRMQECGEVVQMYTTREFEDADNSG